jgi:hypothetical protein
MAESESVVVAEYFTEEEAEAALAVLREAGIPGCLGMPHPNSATGPKSFGPIYSVRVLVSRQVEAAARKVLHAATPAPGPEDDWDREVKARNHRIDSAYLFGGLAIPGLLLAAACFVKDGGFQAAAVAGIVLSLIITFGYLVRALFKRPRR